MRKILTLCALFACAVSVNAQSSDRIFKPFKWNIATGYAIPAGEGTKGGLIFSMEPKYAVLEQVAVGLRMQGAVMANVTVDPNTGEEYSGEVKANSSYVLTGDYYFTNNKFRPFAGVGTGIFSTAAASFSSTTDNEDAKVGAKKKFGGLLRGGFEFGHFRGELEYNLIGATEMISPTDGSTQKVKNGYLGIKIGFNIGGGMY